MSENQISLQDYIRSNRNQIIVIYDNAKEVALKIYDDVITKWLQQIKTNEEVKKKLDEFEAKFNSEPKDK